MPGHGFIISIDAMLKQAEEQSKDTLERQRSLKIVQTKCQELKKQIEANKHLKPLGRANRRSEIGTIVILCGTWFKNPEDLNKHIESVHANFDLSNFPGAHKVPTKSVNTPAPARVNSVVSDNLNAGVVQIRGAQQVSLEEYAKSRTYERPNKNDSTDQVLEKLKTLLLTIDIIC